MDVGWGRRAGAIGIGGWDDWNMISRYSLVLYGRGAWIEVFEGVCFLGGWLLRTPEKSGVFTRGYPSSRGGGTMTSDLPRVLGDHGASDWLVQLSCCVRSASDSRVVQCPLPQPRPNTGTGALHLNRPTIAIKGSACRGESSGCAGQEAPAPVVSTPLPKTSGIETSEYANAALAHKQMPPVNEHVQQLQLPAPTPRRIPIQRQPNFKPDDEEKGKERKREVPSYTSYGISAPGHSARSK
ncbi:hypothetical protein BV22DRAFT_1046859 [Leucogyrophana mollusca]|uniref:Uncharacterized protein n=1 Tax=Leucogyrophana mollusca TaxID=85980 RepID=A0ACB8BJ83_9AGAM|nr:hypothetical protein BV22DRAFT_1046859 [Leucogyrophana mollusca]